MAINEHIVKKKWLKLEGNVVQMQMSNKLWKNSADKLVEEVVMQMTQEIVLNNHSALMPK